MKTMVHSCKETYVAVKTLTAGDTLVFANGSYENIQLILSQEGRKEHPIVLVAETPGKVIFCGDVKVALHGAYNGIEGIALNFDAVLKKSANQRPLRIEDILAPWMLETLGDYYKTGKLSPEMAERLRVIGSTRDQ